MFDCVGAGSTGFGIRRKEGNLGFGFAEKKDASALTSFTTAEAVAVLVLAAEGSFAPGICFTPLGGFAAVGVGLDAAPVLKATFFVGPGLLAGSADLRFLDAFASAAVVRTSWSGSSRTTSEERTKVLFGSVE